VKRRAKIVCTLGPATASYEGVRALVYAGMDVARLNFSHGAYEHHQQAYTWVRQASDESAAASASSSTCRAEDPHRPLRRRPVVWATARRSPSRPIRSRATTTASRPPTSGSPTTCRSATGCSSTTAGWGCASSASTARRASAGHRGGPVSNNKGLSLPGVAVSVPALTEKDEADLRFALTLRADLIALSFVRTAADIEPVHTIMDEVGQRLPVLAKLEKPRRSRTCTRSSTPSTA
jgi:pyruvate kinase